MKKRFLGSPGWSLFFLLLPALIGVCVALLLGVIQWLRG